MQLDVFLTSNEKINLKIDAILFAKQLNKSTNICDNLKLQSKALETKKN